MFLPEDPPKLSAKNSQNDQFAWYFFKRPAPSQLWCGWQSWREICQLWSKWNKWQLILHKLQNTRSSVTSPHGSCIKLHWTITNNNPTADTESTETPPQAFSFLPTLTIKTGVHQGNSVVLSSRWPQKRSYALPKSGSSKPGLNVADVGSWASPR